MLRADAELPAFEGIARSCHHVSCSDQCLVCTSVRAPAGIAATNLWDNLGRFPYPRKNPCASARGGGQAPESHYFTSVQRVIERV